MDRLAPSPKHAGIPRFQTQGDGIRRDIRAGFINNSNDTDRNPHAPHLHPVRPCPHLRHGTEWIRERSHLAQACRHLDDPLGRQTQPVRHRLLPRRSPEGLQIQFIRGAQYILLLFQRLCHCEKGPVLYHSRKCSQSARSTFGSRDQFVDILCDRYGRNHFHARRFDGFD